MKKLCSLLLVVALSLSLAACALPQGGATESSSSATEETETVTEPATEATETLPTATGPVIYRCAGEKHTYSDGTGQQISRTFDEKGNVLTKSSTFLDGSPQMDVTYFYDEAGNVLTEQSICAEDNTGYLSTNTYDSENRLIRNVYESVGGQKLKNTTEYTYDEAGKLTKETRTETDGMRHIYAYSYNNNGQLTRVDRKVTNKKGSTQQESYEIYTYDKQGNKVNWWERQGARRIWTYDDRGNVLSETEKDKNGSVLVKMTYTYDDQDRLLSESWYQGNASKQTEAYVYTYDEAGRVLARYTCTNSTDIADAHAVIRYTYDEFGNLLSEETSDSRIDYTYIAIELPMEQKET